MACEHCIRLLHTGEAKILVAFTVRELKMLVEDTCDVATQERLLKAIGLLNAGLERELRLR